MAGTLSLCWVTQIIRTGGAISHEPRDIAAQYSQRVGEGNMEEEIRREKGSKRN